MVLDYNKPTRRIRSLKLMKLVGNINNFIQWTVVLKPTSYKEPRNGIGCTRSSYCVMGLLLL